MFVDDESLGGVTVLIESIPLCCNINIGIYIYLLTYLLTPWSRVFLEKLTGFAASQEIPRILLNPKVHIYILP